MYACYLHSHWSSLLPPFCLISPWSRSPAFEPSPKKSHHTVSDKAMIKKRKMAFLQKLGVRNSDLDIIEVGGVVCFVIV